MDNARKDEIEYKFIITDKISIDELKEIEIQELIFLISAAKYFKKERVFNVDFDSKIELFKEILLNKIKESNDLYIAYAGCTSYPYLDKDDCVWIFSNEDIGDKAKENLRKKSININLLKIHKDNFNEEMSNLYRIGVNKIIVDYGENSIKINREDLLSKSDLDCDNQYNSKLLNSLIKYAQLIKADKEKYFHNFEDKMIIEIITADYLVPVLNESNEKDDMPITLGTTFYEDKKYLSVFTDMVEYEKAFPVDKWRIHILSYNDIILLGGNFDGFIINCDGAKAIIDDINKAKIDEYRKVLRDEELKRQRIEEAEIEKTKTKIDTPKVYPYKMAEALKRYMRKSRKVNKAYLREVSKNDEVSYLVVLDYIGDSVKLFGELCNVAIPYLDGNNIDVVDIKSDFGMKAVIGSEPFYKRNILDYIKEFSNMK